MPQENKIQLSIIIPVFNEENFLNKLFNELTQYFNNKDTEVIIIDDGSTDSSNNIIIKFKDDNEYMFYFKVFILDKNSGKGKALQVGSIILKENLFYWIWLELDTKDSHEMYQFILNNSDIKCIFGSRYLSGKLKK